MPAKIEEFAQKSKFENNKEKWEIILANANYNQKTKEIKFNINQEDPGFVYNPAPQQVPQKRSRMLTE